MLHVNIYAFIESFTRPARHDVITWCHAGERPLPTVAVFALAVPPLPTLDGISLALVSAANWETWSASLERDL